MSWSIFGLSLILLLDVFIQEITITEEINHIQRQINKADLRILAFFCSSCHLEYDIVQMTATAWTSTGVQLDCDVGEKYSSEPRTEVLHPCQPSRSCLPTPISRPSFQILVHSKISISLKCCLQWFCFLHLMQTLPSEDFCGLVNCQCKVSQVSISSEERKCRALISYTCIPQNTFSLSLLAFFIIFLMKTCTFKIS